jgi:hypothetical protein
MNDKKREKVVHCWRKTGLTAIWDVNERAILTPKAFAETARLFPGHDNVDNSGVVNEEDDKEPEQSFDFISAVDTKVDSETGIVTSKEAEEDNEVEAELVETLVGHAQSIVESAVDAPGKS